MKKPLISRDELLGGGLKGRKRRAAQSVLKVIEARVAQLKRDAEVSISPAFGASTRVRVAEYLETLAQSDGGAASVTIQELERFAPQWASLVPDNPSTRAATLVQVFEKYRLSREHTPRLQAALGMAHPEVLHAFESQTGAALETWYVAATSGERLTWLRARVSERFETLPPFWTAFALTTNAMFGPSILAMPIAFAGLGPVLGVLVLLTLAFVNVLTFGYLAEACARNSGIARGSGTIGSIVVDYLGAVPAKILQIMLFVYCSLVVFVIFVGFGAAVGQMTGTSDAIWLAVIFAVSVFVLSRKTLNLTITSGLIAGSINLTMLVLMMALVVWSTPLSTYASSLAATDFGGLSNPSVLTLVFGTTLYSFCAQTAVTNCAQVVLKADPSGRSLARGSMAGFTASAVFFCVWILVVNGAISKDVLIQETTTSLAPMAERSGTLIHVFGAIFIVVAFGTSAIANGVGCVATGRDLIEDFLNRGRAAFGGGRVRQSDMTADMLTLMSLPMNERRAFSQIVRQAIAGATDILVAPKDMEPATFERALGSLQRRGMVQADRATGVLRAKVLVRMPKGAGALEGVLGKDLQGDVATASAAETPRRRLTSQLVLISPLVVIFLIAEALYFSGLLSFASALNVVGVLLAPMIAAVFPVLLFRAGRRAGRAIKPIVAPLFGTGLVGALILMVALTCYLVHALVIWDTPFLIALAAGFGVLALAIIGYVTLRGGLRPALLIEVFDERASTQSMPYAFTYNGQPVDLPHRILTLGGRATKKTSSGGDLLEFGDVSEMLIEGAIADVRTLRVSAQRQTQSGVLMPADAWLRLLLPSEQRALQLKDKSGEVRLLLDEPPSEIGLRFR